MNNLKERPNYIDLAKGLAMFAVILGHYIYCFNVPFTPNTAVTRLSHFVTLFHMPFFFVITGMVSSFNIKNIADYTRKLFKTLLLPYLLFGLVLGGMWTTINFVKTGDVFLYVKFILALISGSDFKGCSLGWASQLWFVYALFFIKFLIGYGFAVKKRIVKIIYFGVLFAGGGMTMYGPINPLPFRIDCILVGLLFVFIGYAGKSIALKLCANKRMALASFLVSCLIVALFEIFYIDNSIRQCLSINANYFGSIPVLFIISGVAGTVMILGLSRLLFIKHKSLLVMSNGLIAFLALHKVLFFILNQFYYTDTIIGMIGTSLLVFILMFPITIFINRYMPILLGFRK